MMLLPIGVILFTKIVAWFRRDRSHERELREMSRAVSSRSDRSTGLSVLRAALVQSSYKALPIWLRISFLAFPSVSSLAFKAFRCDDLDASDEWPGPAVMSADLSVTCWDEHDVWTDEYTRIRQLAMLAIVLYPICIPFAYAFLFWKVRDAV